MTCIDNAMWNIMDIFDDIYFELHLILLAIELDEISSLLASPPPQDFDPLRTFGRFWDTMPAYRSLSSSLSSFSSLSDSNQRPLSVENPNFSFLDFIKLFNSDDSFLALQSALFGWEDLAAKTNEIKYLATLVERLQDEANRQQEHIKEMFNDMEVKGLHKILKKHFVRDNRVIWPRRGVEFNLPRYHKKKYSLYCWRSTPFPPVLPSRSETPVVDDLPIGNYKTISRYPLDGGFIHHYVRLAAPKPSTSSIIPKEEPLLTIQATRTMPKIKINWLTYQGGMGSRFNPIIVEDDWFGESMV